MPETVSCHLQADDLSSTAAVDVGLTRRKAWHPGRPPHGCAGRVHIGTWTSVHIPGAVPLSKRRGEAQVQRDGPSPTEGGGSSLAGGCARVRRARGASASVWSGGWFCPCASTHSSPALGMTPRSDQHGTRTAPLGAGARKEKTRK